MNRQRDRAREGPGSGDTHLKLCGCIDIDADRIGGEAEGCDRRCDGSRSGHNFTETGEHPLTRVDAGDPELQHVAVIRFLGADRNPHGLRAQDQALTDVLRVITAAALQEDFGRSNPFECGSGGVRSGGSDTGALVDVTEGARGELIELPIDVRLHHNVTFGPDRRGKVADFREQVAAGCGVRWWRTIETAQDHLGLTREHVFAALNIADAHLNALTIGGFADRDRHQCPGAGQDDVLTGVNRVIASDPLQEQRD